MKKKKMPRGSGGDAMNKRQKYERDSELSGI